MLNYFGVRRSSRANLVVVLISVSSLTLFIVSGAGAVRMSNFEPFMPAGWEGVLRSAAVLFFAYTGYARIATLGEEVREPRRTIPRAIMITIWGAIILYAATGVVAAGAVSTSTLAGTPAPLVKAAEAFGPEWLPAAMAIGGITAMLGVVLSQLLGLSRMVFAMARRHDLPQSLGAVSERHGVPGRAVLVVGGIAAVVAATGTLAGVAAAASFTILLYYGIANVAALRMPVHAKLFSDVVPWFGLLSCLLLALSLSPRTIISGLAVLAVGFALRMLVRRRAAAD